MVVEIRLNSLYVAAGRPTKIRAQGSESSAATLCAPLSLIERPLCESLLEEKLETTRLNMEGVRYQR